MHARVHSCLEAFAYQEDCHLPPATCHTPSTYPITNGTGKLILYHTILYIQTYMASHIPELFDRSSPGTPCSKSLLPLRFRLSDPQMRLSPARTPPKP